MRLCAPPPFLEALCPEVSPGLTSPHLTSHIMAIMSNQVFNQISMHLHQIRSLSKKQNKTKSKATSESTFTPEPKQTPGLFYLMLLRDLWWCSDLEKELTYMTEKKSYKLCFAGARPIEDLAQASNHTKAGGFNFFLALNAINTIYNIYLYFTKPSIISFNFFNSKQNIWSFPYSTTNGSTEATVKPAGRFTFGANAAGLMRSRSSSSSFF